MSSRLYTLLFAILPRSYQDKLWGRLANKYGYHGLTKFGNGTIYLMGTRKKESDLYGELIEAMQGWQEEAPTMFENPNCN